MERNSLFKGGLKSKVLVPTGILILVIIIVLSAVSFISLQSAYSHLIESENEGFDNVIRIAVESMVTALKANHQRYLDGKTTFEEAYEAAVVMVRDARFSTTPFRDRDGYFWADMSDGLCAVHYHESSMGNNRWDTLDRNPKGGKYYVRELIQIGDRGGGFSEFYTGKPGDENGSHLKKSYTEKFEPYGWYISTGNYYSDVEAVMEEAISEENQSLLLLFGISFFSAIVALVILSFILTGIIKPIKRLVDVADNVAEGNLNINIDTSQTDEIGMLAKSFSNIIAVAKNLASDIHGVAYNYDIGDLSKLNINEALYKGQFTDIVKGVNKTVSDLVESILYAIQFASALGDGNFNVEVKKFAGDKIIMTNSLQTARDSLLRFNNDITFLINGAGAGDLRITLDTSTYKGDWNKMASGLNNLMNAISAPTGEVLEVMNHLSVGRFDLKMNGNYKGDFLTLKDSINATVTNIASYIEEISRVLTKMAQNDFNQSVTREYVGDYSQIKDALNNIIDTFNQVIGDISAAAEQVSNGARSISESSMTLASGASEQASSVEELNATIQIINESTSNNAENAKNAETFSNHSKENAAMGNADMKNMLVSMEGIKDSSNRITKIIKVIQDIAFQTNLLALNAAVEAARAGEHGKGFAVVAEEVRTLASRSQAAAKETAELIDESISRVDEGSKIAEQTAEALQTIMDDISKIADIIVNIASVSKEQSTAIRQVTEGLSQITNVVQNNSATSEESASGAQQLSSQAELLNNLVSVFKMKK